MSRYLLSFLMLFNAYAFGFHDADSDYMKARVHDSSIHFELILDDMLKEKQITNKTALAIRKTFKQLFKIHNRQNEFFYDEADKLAIEHELPEEVLGIFKKSWDESFGFIYLKHSIEHNPQEWLELYHKENITPHEKKKIRASIYEQTKSAVMNGYVISETFSKLPVNHKSRVFLNGLQKMQRDTYAVDTLPPLNSPGPYNQTEIRIVEADTIDLTRQLQLEGFYPVALNFANKTTAGGGAVRGAQAQEEDLFRRSAYFLGLDINYNHFLFEKMKGKYLVPEFGSVYTPQVPIIRGNESQGYPFIEPFEVDFIANAAYDLSTPKKKEALKDPSDYIEGTKEKIRNVLRLGVKTRHDAVVLGAFGCGAFKNDPVVVATLMKDVLAEEEFVGHFRLVAFGILNGLESHNFEIFQEIFYPTK